MADRATIKRVFLEAASRPKEARAAFVAQACGGDESLRREVESLLAHHDDSPLIAEKRRQPVGAPALIGQVLDDRYRIDALVAEGGFAHVFKAQHLRWRRPVAVKVFKQRASPTAHDEVKEAFIKEGALLNELSRKTTAIVQSYDVGTCTTPDGVPHLFTVLEWLEGRSLADAIQQERKRGDPPWGLDRVLATLAPVAEALEVAHASGIAHRDVKPRNVFLVEETGLPWVKLLDFGAAKVARERTGGFMSTGAGPVALTARYAAPEQLDKRLGPSGPWSDVWSLALLTVELLLGKHPFAEGQRHERPTPRRMGVWVPDPIEHALDRALAPSPQERPPEAGAFWRSMTR